MCRMTILPNVGCPQMIRELILFVVLKAWSGGDVFVLVFVLMGWSLLPDALRPLKIYCAPPNLVTGRWNA